MTLQISAVEIRSQAPAPKPVEAPKSTVSKQPAVRPESAQRVEVTPPAAETAQIIAPADQAKIVATASQGVKSGEARPALFKLIAMSEKAKDAKGEKALKVYLKALKESKNPADRALAMDFEIAQQQIKLAGIENKIGEYKKMLSETGISAEVTKLYETTIKQLELQKDGVKDEQGTVKEEGVADVIIRLNIERAKVPGNPPNAFQELATRLGISQDEAKANPLRNLEQMFKNIAGDKKADANFVKHLQEKNFSKDEISAAKDAIRLMRGEPTKIEWTRGLLIKGGGLIGALTLFMAWLGSKEKQTAGAMG